MTTVILDAACRYIEQGRAPVPIPPKTKGPVIKGWQKLRLTLDDVPKHFNGHEQNIGLILGEASNGLTDADLDCKEARDLAHHFLPKTGLIFGRQSAPRSHWGYVVNPAMETEQWAAPTDKDRKGKSMLVELRGTGAQTVFPPSVHPSGESVRFDEDGEPAVVERAVLVRAASRLAAACLLVRYWPDGSRHSCVLALAGGLLRGGWTEDDTVEFIRAIATVTESETTEKHLAAVRDTAKKLAEGGTDVTGWPKLSELLGDRVVKKAMEWCECEFVSSEVASDVVSDLNTKHAVVWVGGRCAVLTEVEDTRRQYKTITLSKQSDFTLFYKNRQIQVGKRRMDLGSYWLGHSARRQYRRVVFAPEGCAPDEFNLWRGFAVEPKEGNCELYLEHTRNVICGGNETHYRWVLAWKAMAVQHPCVRLGTSLVMRGPEGVGKGIEAKGFGRLFGQHYVPLTQSRHLVGNFNAHLRDALVVFVDEAFWAGDKSAEGVLKALITEDRHMVESKGFDPIQVDNYTHYIISSNNDWIVPAGATSRRFAVFDVCDTHRQDIEYFRKIETQMENGGSAALLHFLLHYDGSAVDLRRVPQTTALMDQKDHTMTPVQKFWFNCLKAGSQIGERVMRDGGFYPDQGWEIEIRSGALYDAYITRSQQAGIKRRAMEMELAEALKKMVPKVEHRKIWVEGRQTRGWKFPLLDECRKAFDTYMNWTYSWPDDLDDPKAKVGSSESGS